MSCRAAIALAMSPDPCRAGCDVVVNNANTNNRPRPRVDD
jgi:hypothetical protein